MFPAVTSHRRQFATSFRRHAPAGVTSKHQLHLLYQRQRDRHTKEIQIIKENVFQLSDLSSYTATPSLEDYEQVYDVHSSFAG